MAQPYLITGAEGKGTYPRLELRDLQKNPIQFSLFIQAMSKLTKMNNTQDPQSKDFYKQPNSWQEIGGIHGLPYRKWSGDPEGPPEAKDTQWGGYCYHASVLFPCWHRVLLLLVEQAMITEAIAIASECENEEWTNAANCLRFPYWDWTHPSTAEEGIPKLCQQPQVEIATPNGSTVVDNPLNHYKFAVSPGKVNGANYMDSWTRTYRWPNNDENPTSENYDQSQEAFASGMSLAVGDQSVVLQPLGWLRGKVAALFTYDLTVKDSGYGGNMFAYFSCTGAENDGVDSVMPTMPPSLEEPHNMVHLDVGGTGSMSFNDTAGFDPIFFLHHCNVDRLYAFWEYIYPYFIGKGWKSILTGEIYQFVTDTGTFYQDSGSGVDNLTPCHPFRTKTGDYWTSEEVRGLLNTSPVNKYYTYPPITDPQTGTTIDVNVPYNVDDLPCRERYQRILYNKFSQDLDTIVSHHQNFKLSSPLHAHVSNLLLQADQGTVSQRHFYLVGRLPEFAFTGSYRLELYVLDHPNSPAINSISVLGRADPDKCAACVERRAAGSHVRGHMPLDPRLILHLVNRLHPTRLGAITELTHLAAVIHESFGVRLVRPGGARLAVADPNTPTHHAPLDASKTPKLTLHSHIIKMSHADTTAPVSFHGHEDHGAFGTALEWKVL